MRSPSCFLPITRLTILNGSCLGTISYSSTRPAVLATSSPSMRTRIAACRSSSPWS